MGKEQEKAIVQAVDQLKKLAAKCMIRKETLEKEIRALKSRLEKDDASLQLAIERSEDETAMELLKTKANLEAELTTKEDDLALAAQQYDQSLNEIRELKRSAEELKAAEQRAAATDALSADPFDTSAEDSALENVRNHIHELDARARLNDELSGNERRLNREIRAIEEQEAELKAKQQLAELKAKLKGGPKPTAQADDTTPDAPADDKPKRTM